MARCCLWHRPTSRAQITRRGTVKQSVAFNLINRMRSQVAALLRFVTDLRLPFTNNLTERAIRMRQAGRKIAGCFGALAGAETFRTIRSDLDTMHKQGHNRFEVLHQTFTGLRLSPDSA